MTRNPHPYTDDPEIYLVSGDGLCRNNMHYESGRAGYLPNDAATSESQALLARGYIRHYAATGTKSSLTNACALAEAAISYFFLGDPPNDGSAWNHHWVVNAGDGFNIKGPVSAYGHAFDGTIGEEVTFTNGVATLSTDLSNVYGVFTGSLVWNNVFSDVQSGGAFEEIDYFVDRDGYLFTYVSGSAASIEFTVPSAPQTAIAPGTLKLKDTTLSGTYKVNYALWESSGEIDYAAKFDVWPMWHGVDATTYNTAPDALGWFADLFDLLAAHDTDNTTRWVNARNSLLTVWKKICVLTSSEPYLFRRDTAGVTYDSWPLTYFEAVLSSGTVYTSPTDYLTYSRDSNTGLVVFGLPADTDRTSFLFVQDAASMTLGASSTVTAELATSTALSLSLQVTATLANGASGTWTALVQTTADVATYTLSLADFGVGGAVTWVPGDTEFTFSTVTASTTTATDSSGKTLTVREYVIADNGSGAGFSTSSFTDWSASAPPVVAYLTSDSTIVLTVIDSDGWRWEYTLPVRTTSDPLALSWSDFTASSYQTNTGTAPSSAGTATGAIQTVQFGNSASTSATVEVIAVYSVMPVALGAGAIISKAKLIDTDTAAHTLTVGDVQITGGTTVEQPYTPGALPFAWGSSSTGQYASGGGGFWQGPAYMGYQQPAVWFLIGDFGAAKNMLQMMRDSQKAYAAQSPSGTSGPFVPTWLFHQWDSEQYGTGGTFVFNGPDPNWFWGGYTYRAFAHAADFWQRCVLAGYTADASGTDAEQATALAADVAGAFMGWLNTWLGLHPDVTAIPTQFLAAQDPSDATTEPHQVALALKGALWCQAAGYDSNVCTTVINRLISMLDAAVVTAGDMAGSLSPNPDGHQFYAFWAGEILDALALYILYYGSE